MTHLPSISSLSLLLTLTLALGACGDKTTDDTATTGTADGGTTVTDGGTTDGGTTVTDGGATDGGTTVTDGGTTDGGTTDGGTTDGGTTDGGTTDGGTTDGGTTDGGTTDGGTVTIETDCSDGIDDDGDGRIDCDDRDCRRDPACADEICDNSVDDDGDGLIDCDDDDCLLDPACAAPTTCPETDLGTATGDAVGSGDNSSSLDDFSGSCGSTGGLDVSFAWEAPADGCYTVDTEDSDYDTVLRIFDECSGTELDCDDDGGATSLTSKLSLEAVAGDTYLLVVDGYSSTATGTYSLDINELTTTVTADADLGSTVGDAVASGTFDGTEDRTLEPSCGSSTGLDLIYSWSAPTTDTYVFDTEDSAIDTVLSLHSDSGCYTELDCDDDGGATSLTSRIELGMTLGDKVLIRMGSYSSTTVGDWSLDINVLGTSVGGSDTGVRDTGVRDTGVRDTGATADTGVVVSPFALPRTAPPAAPKACE